MIRILAFTMLAFFLFNSCKKSSSGSSTTVEYQVTAINSSGISITYVNAIGDTTITSANTSWSYNFTPQLKPFTAYIRSSSTSPFTSVTTSCTVNIVVNGSTAKTNTASGNTVATAIAQYAVQ